VEEWFCFYYSLNFAFCCLFLFVCMFVFPSWLLSRSKLQFVSREELESHMRERQHCFVKSSCIRDWSLDSEYDGWMWLIDFICGSEMLLVIFVFILLIYYYFMSSCIIIISWAHVLLLFHELWCVKLVW
jgi:hypothetical protein